MGLKSPAAYVESLRDGRVTFWDGERIDDITTHPRFRTPIANTAADYAYDDPERGGILSYETEEGDRAHRIFQIPRTEADLAARVKLMHNISIGTAVSGVFMALMSVKDQVGEVSPQYAENIERMYR
ncbi:4-hydroxyphenylacetate 3-hydroxylase N-terminal domain-containing protein, partial [uncultured Phenylobacterium sp.]|uniref:4-hydroxyphenylacetate 3-hydroxylase N-terminal domain-containing protein n=1 Tax=uncultured Phenylobacterium sp. TaxID=349273 RepID=UPI0025CBF17C